MRDAAQRGTTGTSTPAQLSCRVTEPSLASAGSAEMGAFCATLHGVLVLQKRTQLQTEVVVDV
jgi:hypothetical protein